MTNMTSVVAAGAGARPSQLHLPTAKPQIPITHAFKLSAVKSAPVNFRFKTSVLRLQIRERWHAVSASKNANPPLYDYGDSIKDKSGTVEKDDAAQGTSLLTILDGLLRLIVFFVVFVFASVLSWCIGFFVTMHFIALALSSGPPK
ncbi:hypothetical protein ACFX2C_039700 [Malus domestica]